jgi:hypothetical protein
MGEEARAQGLALADRQVDALFEGGQKLAA